MTPTEKTRSEIRKPLPVEQYLSGDFVSPVEVLADNGLSDKEKTQILQVWRSDLENLDSNAEVRALRRAVDDALARLRPSGWIDTP